MSADHDSDHDSDLDLDLDPIVAAIARAATAVGAGTPTEATRAIEALADLDHHLLVTTLAELVLASARRPTSDAAAPVPGSPLPGLARLDPWLGHDEMTRFVQALDSQDAEALTALTGGTLEGFVTAGLAVLYALGTSPPPPA